MLPPNDTQNSASQTSTNKSDKHLPESLQLTAPLVSLPKAHGSSNTKSLDLVDLPPRRSSRPSQLLDVMGKVPSVDSSNASLPTLSPGVLSMQSDPRSPGNFSLHMPSPGVNEIPLHHQGIMKVIETWLHISSVDLETNDVMRKEMKDFLTRMASLGPEHKLWSQRMQAKLRLEVKTSDVLQQLIDSLRVFMIKCKCARHFKLKVHSWLNTSSLHSLA